MKKVLIAATTVGLFAAGAAFAQTAEIGTWAGFRKGAASFTFDDGAPSHVNDAGPMFKKYGYKATFNLVVNWNPNWSGFQGLADEGHEIASHSNSHGNNMSGEEASSKNNIKSKINQKYGIITVAYPNCNVPNESAVLQNYIVGRICNGSWQSMSDDMGKDGPSNWAKVPAIMTGSENGGINNTNGFTSKMQGVISKNGWVAFLTHGFQGKSNGNANYSPTDINAIDGALRWAQQNDKDIWVAPMGHVAMYIKERKASKVEASGSGTITVKLTHNIADNVSKYDYPLSIRVKYDGSKAEVTQAGAKLESKIDGGYVYFDAVPNAGDIVIAGEGAGPSPESSSSAEPPQSSSSEAKSSSSTNPWGPKSSSSKGEVDCSANPFDPSCHGMAIAAELQNDFGLSVYRSSDNYIVVGGAQGMSITVFNSLGHQVRTTRGLGAVQKVYTGAKGVYIVKVGGKSFKVKL